MGTVNSVGTHRWGIFSVAVVMALLTLLVGKGSMYSMVWCYIAYHAYRNNLETIGLILGIVIFINVAGLLGILIFTDASSSLWHWLRVPKMLFIIGMGITLFVKVALIVYVQSLTKNAQQITYPVASPSSLATKSTVPAISNTETVVPTVTSVEQPAIPLQTEDAWYEQALDELNSGQTIKALWARSMAEGNGDDAKAKSTYIRLRVAQQKAWLDEQDSIKTESERLAKVEAERLTREKAAKHEAERLTGVVASEITYWWILPLAFILIILVGSFI